MPQRIPRLVLQAGSTALACGALAAPAFAASLDAAELPAVEVKAEREATGSAADGYRSKSASVGLLGMRPLDELPYSISVTSSALIENLHANRATEALRYEPTVNPEMGSNRTGDYLAIRGFINSSNQAIDGMRANVAAGGWLEDKERVEILSGATGFLYGIASPAGMVNYVLKRPTATPIHSLTFGDYGGQQAFVHLDAGGPLDEAGRFAYRVNAVGVDSGSTGVEQERQPRNLLSAAFDWQIAPDTRLSFDAARYRYELQYAQAFFFVNNVARVPSAPDAAKNYSAPYSTMAQEYETQGVNLSSKINEYVTLRGGLRHGHADLRYSGVRDRFINASGDYTQEMMYYRAPNITSEDRGNLFADFVFQSGPLSHALTLGFIAGAQQVSSAGTSTYYFPASQVISVNTPTYQADPNVNTANPAYITNRTRQQNLVVADQISINEQWSILVGANRSGIDDRNYSSSNGSLSSRYDKQAATPSLALMFRPQAGLMVYGSYIEALEEGATAPSTAANAGDLLAPYLSSQYEVGGKFSLGGVDLKTALFRIEKESAYTDPTTKIFAADGRQLHRGLEFSFAGKISQHLTLLGGFSVLDARLTRTANAAMLDKTPQAVPDKLLRLYGEYALPDLPGLVLTGGLSHTGAAWADDLNTKSYPAVTVGDLGMRYLSQVAGHQTIFRVNINNVTDRSYWTSKGGSMLYLGSPRIVAASASFEF